MIATKRSCYKGHTCKILKNFISDDKKSQGRKYVNVTFSKSMVLLVRPLNKEKHDKCENLASYDYI